MSCAACQSHVEKAARAVFGVANAEVSLVTNSLTIECEEGAVSADAVIAAVTDAGYGASVYDPEKAKNREDPLDVELKTMKKRLIISLCLMIPMMYLTMGHMVGLHPPSFLHGSENALRMAALQLIITIPVMIVNKKFFLSGFAALRHRAPNMDSLIAVGASASVVYGIFAIERIATGLIGGNMALVDKYRADLYFESAVMILTLITLGKFLETRSRKKTGAAIAALMDLAPKTATLLKDGNEVTVPVEEVSVGDLLVVRPGQSIPVDGVVIEGSGAVDQSAITGESIPVEKHPGDKVTAATINRNGRFVFKAEKVGDDTTLSQIIRLVEEASGSKAPIAQLADKIAAVFVPTVMAISAVTGIGWLIYGMGFEFALSTAISVLVISCPCALGLATPVAIMVGTGQGAKHGILIKSAQALEAAHNIDTIVLDKTGTITTGSPAVTDILPAIGISENELLFVAASLEKPSEHPLAEAIVQKAEAADIETAEVTDFMAVPGRGLTAALNGKSHLAGNLAMLCENGIDTANWPKTAERLAEEGKTPLFFAREGEILGIIAVADPPKATSAEAIELLNSMGIETVMLTGDNERTAKAVAKSLALSRVIADVLPQDKERVVRELQESGKRVMMVGDGINDAPALARADVGMAIGAGTDVAIESADIVLMRSDLRDVATAVSLSRAVLKTIRQNLFWAFFYNTIGIPLAAGLLWIPFSIRLSPMIGAAAMSMSSVCVVTNALRLRSFIPPFAKAAAATENINTPHEIEEDDDTMKKIVTVEGMHCPHCQMTVEKTLSAIEGVSSCKVDLAKKTATCKLEADVADDVLTAAVANAGFTPVKVETKKGLFG